MVRTPHRHLCSAAERLPSRLQVQSPKCIAVVLNWAHGQFTFNSNGSLTLVPVADGYQRIQEPCSANSDFTEDYHLQEMYQSWRIFLNAVDGPKFHLFAFDGSPEPPMRLLSQTMLPTQFLRSTTDATTTILKRSNNDVVVPASSALSSCEDLSTKASPSSSASSSADNVLFTIDDDNDEQETSALDGPPHRRGRADQAVHFREHVRVVAPPLRSNLESREAGTSAHACILHRSSRRAI